jgi:hypothetical protein
VPGQGLEQAIRYRDFRGAAGKPVKLSGFIVANGFQKSAELFHKNSRVRSFVLILNGKPRYLLNLGDFKGLQLVRFPELELARNDLLELKIVDVYGGMKFQDTCLSLLLPYHGKQETK